MSRLFAIALLAGMTGCALPAPPPALNCATRPPDFRSFVQPDWTGSALPIEPPLINKIRVEGNPAKITWNGVPLGEQEEDVRGWRTLALYLEQAGRLEPMPYVTLLFERGVACADIDRVRAMIRARMTCTESQRCFQGPAPY